MVYSTQNFDYHTLRSQVSQELAVYKQPRKYVVLDALPRNAMGKVNKKELLKLYLEKEAQSSPRAAIVQKKK